MNVLEAIEAIKSGKVVKHIRGQRYIPGAPEFTFYIQTCTKPLNVKQVWRYESDEVDYLKNKPKTLNDICAGNCKYIHINIVGDDIEELVFEESTVDKMLEDLQKRWDETHEGD